MERRIAEQLAEMIDTMANYQDFEDTPVPEFIDEVKRATTFERDGVLSGNSGVVIKMKDGKVYQLSIVRAR